jgi:hypothetical protein
LNLFRGRSVLNEDNDLVLANPSYRVKLEKQDVLGPGDATAIGVLGYLWCRAAWWTCPGYT